MKILKIPPYYAPELISSSHLTDDLEKAYVAAGHTIEIYAPTPSRGVSDEVREEYKKIKYEQKLGGKVTVRRFSMVKEGSNPILRALRYIIIARKQRKLAMKSKDVDVITCSTTPPTLGLTAARIAKKLSKKQGKKVSFIFSVQDLFPDSLASTGLAKKGSPIYKLGAKIAKKIYNCADLIITISEDIKKNIVSQGVPEEKVRVIFNWVNTDEVKPVAKEENKLFSELSIDKDKFNVVYAGNLGMAQGAEVIVEAARELRDRGDIAFTVFGKGAREEYIRSLAEGLDNIKFFPLMPAERVSEVYSLADASIVCCKPGSAGACVPSKTWSIMACATPLLVAFDKGCELDRVITAAGAGLVSDPMDHKALAQNVLKLAEDKELTAGMGRAAREYVTENATASISCAKYIAALEEVSGAK